MYQDSADPKGWLERFLVESCVEHLRQDERVTTSRQVFRIVIASCRTRRHAFPDTTRRRTTGVVS